MTIRQLLSNQMRIAATGIVTNEYNDILLIRRDDTLTWSAPGGSLEPGELPTAGVAREVQEETGMVVLPIRLVSTSFWNEEPNAHLHLTFRCLIRGGEPTPSPESPQVGFFKSKALPWPMLQAHRERVEKARYHSGPAIWYAGRQPWYGRRLRRLLKLVTSTSKFRPFQPAGESGRPQAPLWTTRAFALVFDSAGNVLWRQDEGGRPVLPGGLCTAQEAPWEAARRWTLHQTGRQIQLQQLTGLYVRPRSTEMTFTFKSFLVQDKQLPIDSTFFGAPHTAGSPFTSVVQDGLVQGDETIVRYWSETED